MTDICEGDAGQVYTIDPIPDATGYDWSVPPDAVIVSGMNTPSITVDFPEGSESGLVSVYGTNDCGPGNGSDLEVNVNSVPDAPVINYTGDILYSNCPIGNQWYLEGIIILGATEQVYEPQEAGDYYDIVILNECPSEPSNVIYIPGVNVRELDQHNISIYPNPNNGRFNLSFEQVEYNAITLSIFNSLGDKVIEEIHEAGSGNLSYTINLEGLPDGIYFLRIITVNAEITRKIILKNNATINN
jgi:hypothetical protein